MNKKGFTLIELLVVITLLSVLIGIVTINVFKTYNRETNKITKQEKKVISQAVEHLISIIEDCDENVDEELINNLVDVGFISPKAVEDSDDLCEVARESINSSLVEMTLKELKATGYISGSNFKKYDDDSTITIRHENGKYIVDNVSLLLKKQNNNVDEEEDEENTIKNFAQTIKTNNPNLDSESDDNGASYYFTSNNSNNYVNFANMCWRIVRIEGNQSVKLILDDSGFECNSGKNYTGDWYIFDDVSFGYDSNNKADFINFNNGVRTVLLNYEEELENIISSYYGNKENAKQLSDYLVNYNWCYDHSISYYGEPYYIDNTSGGEDEFTNIYYSPYYRTYNNRNSLFCNTDEDGTTEIQNYVGLLTVDEVSLIGSSILSNNSDSWWTLSPSYYHDLHRTDYIYYVNAQGQISYKKVTESAYVRPSIVLKANITVEGSGTKNNPYEIN